MLEALGWWALEGVAYLVLRGPALRSMGKLLGWVFGPKFRSLYRDIMALRDNPGDGRVVARLMKRALSLEHARVLFNRYRVVSVRVDEAYPYAVMIDWLGKGIVTIDTAGEGDFDDGWRKGANRQKLIEEMDRLIVEAGEFPDFSEILLEDGGET